MLLKDWWSWEGSINFRAVVLKRCSGSAAAAWGRMTAVEAEAGLTASGALFLRWCVDVDHLVKIVDVCRSVNFFCLWLRQLMVG